MHIGVFKQTTDFSVSWVPTWTQHGPMLAPKIHENPKKTSSRGCPTSIAFWGPFSCDFGTILAAYLAPSWRPGRPKTGPKSAQDAPKTAPETLKIASGAYFLGFWWIFWKQEPQDPPKRPPEPSKITWKLLTKSFEMTLVQLHVGYIFSTFGLFKTIWW